MTEPEAPQTFGRYRLLALLGKGGTARVYRAVRPGPLGFGKEVALKVIERASTLDEEAALSLVNEARLGCLLKHPNIVSIDEFDEIDSTFYIAMEYVAGWPLDYLVVLHRNLKRLIPLEVVLDILIEVASGLDYAHTIRDKGGNLAGLVHRDLKPGNVMIAQSGAVKITDFGTAKATTNISRTEAGFTRGTPAYMSPEQVAGDPLDNRSDIFSFGAILHELVTLEMTFPGENMVTVMHKVLEVDIREARSRIADAAPGLEPVLKRCLARDPAGRYQTGGSIAEDLRRMRARLDPSVTVRSWLEELAPHLDEPGGTPLGPSSPGTAAWSSGQTADPQDELPRFSAVVVGGPESDIDTSADTTMAPTLPGADESSGEATTEFELRPVLKVTAPRVQPVEAHKNVVKSASSGQRALGLLLRLALLYVAVVVFGPALPGSAGQWLGELRTWQIGLLQGRIAPLPGLPSTASSSSRTSDFMAISPGSLRLGEGGQEAVEVPVVLMMSHEVTVGEYEAGCPRSWWELDCPEWQGRRSWQTVDHPAVGVTWEQARDWCESHGWRLPTEVEWEYAARGTTGRKHPWGNEFVKSAMNYCDIGCTLPTTMEDDGFPKTSPVGSFAAGATPEGIHDLAGNVTEWTLDCWSATYDERTNHHPEEAGDCERRVVRGGSWRETVDYQVGLRRAEADPDLPTEKIGFRCVQGPSPWSQGD